MFKFRNKHQKSTTKTPERRFSSFSVADFDYVNVSWETIFSVNTFSHIMKYVLWLTWTQLNWIKCIEKWRTINQPTPFVKVKAHLPDSCFKGSLAISFDVFFGIVWIIWFFLHFRYVNHILHLFLFWTYKQKHRFTTNALLGLVALSPKL